MAEATQSLFLQQRKDQFPLKHTDCMRRLLCLKKTQDAVIKQKENGCRASMGNELFPIGLGRCRPLPELLTLGASRRKGTTFHYRLIKEMALCPLEKPTHSVYTLGKWCGAIGLFFRTAPVPNKCDHKFCK